MPRELIVPAAVMSLAFVFYTAGVWGERVQRDLLGWHVASFWLGLACDATATGMMERMLSAGVSTGLIHSVTGATAFGLMALHAGWATWVLARGSREARAGFHRYSVAVWAIWLVPYFGGMIAGIARGARG